MTNLPTGENLQKLCFRAEVVSTHTTSKQVRPMHNYALSSRQGRENQRWITSKDKVLSKLRNYCANNHNDPSSISIAQHNDNDNYQLHMNVQDGVKIRLLAGCVPLTNDGHVIFVSSSKHPDQWILPKVSE